MELANLDVLLASGEREAHQGDTVNCYHLKNSDTSYKYSGTSHNKDLSQLFLLMQKKSVVINVLVLYKSGYPRLT